VRTPELDGLPFTILCTLLDRMLAELGRVTPGFGARVALAKVRSWLDPEHRTKALELAPAPRHVPSPVMLELPNQHHQFVPGRLPAQV
jgi:hypothetical protein